MPTDHQPIECSLDWFQYALDWPNEVREWPFDPTEALAVMKTALPYLHLVGFPPQRPSDHRVAGMTGYSEVYDLVYATGHVNPLRRDQRIGVRFTGQDLTLWRDCGGTDKRLVDFANDVRATPSRIDIAFDLRGFQIDPQRVYRDWLHGKVKARAKTLRPIVTGQRLPDGTFTEAATLYIGSRESEVMVRLYEKGKQMHTADDWTRLELEIKGDKAATVLADMKRLGIAPVAQALLAERLEMPYKFWKQVLQGDIPALTPVGRKRTNRQIWLEEVVFPLLQDELWDEWERDENMRYSIAYQLERLCQDNRSKRVMSHRAMMGG